MSTTSEIVAAVLRQKQIEAAEQAAPAPMAPAPAAAPVAAAPAPAPAAVAAAPAQPDRAAMWARVIAREAAGVIAARKAMGIAD